MTVSWPLLFSKDLGVDFRNLNVGFKNLNVGFRKLNLIFGNLNVNFRNLNVNFRNLWAQGPAEGEGGLGGRKAKGWPRARA